MKIWLYLLQITFARGATINIVAYSVNVCVKFYSIEGATVYDAAYSVNFDLETFFEHMLPNQKCHYFCFKLHSLGGATVNNVA